jgi:subfamily B ATP-binding cassette protein MsbA
MESWLLLFYFGMEGIWYWSKNIKRSFVYCLYGLAYNILTPAKSISKASYAVKRGNAAAERFRNSRSAKPNYIKMDGQNSFESTISIKNINFKYEEENVLKDFH